MLYSYVGKIIAAGGKAFAVQGNIASLAGIDELYQQLDKQVHQHTNSNKNDILVNNAGLIDFATVEDSSEEVFDRVFAVNIKGTYFVTQKALKRMNIEASG